MFLVNAVCHYDNRFTSSPSPIIHTMKTHLALAIVLFVLNSMLSFPQQSSQPEDHEMTYCQPLPCLMYSLNRLFHCHGMKSRSVVLSSHETIVMNMGKNNGFQQRAFVCLCQTRWVKVPTSTCRDRLQKSPNDGLCTESCGTGVAPMVSSLWPLEG